MPASLDPDHKQAEHITDCQTGKYDPCSKPHEDTPYLAVACTYRFQDAYHPDPLQYEDYHTGYQHETAHTPHQNQNHHHICVKQCKPVEISGSCSEHAVYSHRL